jgi:PhnB protein
VNTTKGNSVKPIPDGFHTVTPFLPADNAAELIEFIQEAFDEKIKYMMKSDDGIVRHSEVRIGDSIVMVSNGTELYKSMPAMFHLYVEDVDAVYDKAIKAGGESLREPTNEFYGDRSVGVKDKWDNQLWIATHVEDVSDEEMKKREEQFRKEKDLE